MPYRSFDAPNIFVFNKKEKSLKETKTNQKFLEF